MSSRYTGQLFFSLWCNLKTERSHVRIISTFFSRCDSRNSAIVVDILLALCELAILDDIILFFWRGRTALSGDVFVHGAVSWRRTRRLFIFDAFINIWESRPHTQWVRWGLLFQITLVRINRFVYMWSITCLSIVSINTNIIDCFDIIPECCNKEVIRNV